MVRCCTFRGGANCNVSKQFELEQGEILELVRVALNGKQEATSEAVAMSLRQLHRDNPLLKMIVSYADIDHNHLGIIYQATNWIYLGQAGIGSVSYIINGKNTHGRTISSMGLKNNIEVIKEKLDKNAEIFRSQGKHKYIFCFDKKLRKKWLKEAKPYPKKEDFQDEKSS